jgi:hypothetical protein
VFPDTPVQPFERGAFIDALTRAQKVYYSILFFFQYVLLGNTGNCGAYGQFMADVRSMSGFVSIPEAWYALYQEYRLLLAQAPVVSAEMAAACSGGGGEVRKETIQAVVDYVDNTQKRFGQMIVESQSLP